MNNLIGGLDDLSSAGVNAHLKHLAKSEAERIKAMPGIGGDVTVIVILSRPPITEVFAKGPHFKEIGPLVHEAAHAAVNEIARRNA